MRTALILCILIFECAAACLYAQTKPGFPDRIPRYEKERFAGLHLDFHAQKQDTAIGKTFTSSLIDSLLTIAQPDFIQVDCKGHQGYSSYPTKVGNAPAAFQKDIMKIWRAETEKYNVPLFVHYSGVWDNRALELHPDWKRMNQDSSYDNNTVSLLSPYLEQLMIPQLKELAEDYRLDGAWIDGDCWALGLDYSPAVVKAFTLETGISDIPRKRTDPYFFEFREFNRKLFRKYAAAYMNAAHTANPRFRITSNWSFSSMMPEKVDIPVDFLSGDVAGVNSLYSSAFESRCMALQGKPWDLMSWGFAMKDDMIAMKSVTQLEQEGAEVLAMGGGFQTYWQQHHDGSVSPYLFNKMAEIIQFCKARKPYCYQHETAPQIGILYSTYAWKRIPTGGLYSAHSLEAMKGVLNIFLDNQLPVEILMDHHLNSRMEKYALLVIPEWEHIDPAIRQRLLDYVANGGKLLVIGAGAASGFEEQLGIKSSGIQEDKAFYAGLGNDVLHLKTNFLPVTLESGSTATGSQLPFNDWRIKGDYPLASQRTWGKGKMAGIYMDIGTLYGRYKNTLISALIKTVTRELQLPLLSSVSGSPNIHQTVSRKNNRLYIHLINTSGPHDNPNSLTYETISPVTRLKVSARLTKAPTSITLQPGNKKLTYTYAAGMATIQVPQIEVYNIVEIVE